MIDSNSQIVWSAETGTIGGYKRSQAYRVTGAKGITVQIHTDSGVPASQIIRCFGAIKTLNQDNYSPINIDNDVSANNAFAPISIKDLNDGIEYKGSDGISVLASSDGLFSVNLYGGIGFIFFELQGSGVPVTLLFQTFN